MIRVPEIETVASFRPLDFALDRFGYPRRLLRCSGYLVGRGNLANSFQPLLGFFVDVGREWSLAGSSYILGEVVGIQVDGWGPLPDRTRTPRDPNGRSSPGIAAIKAGSGHAVREAAPFVALARLPCEVRCYVFRRHFG